MHFWQRVPEWAHGTLDDIHRQHWGQIQSFSLQLFRNVAPIQVLQCHCSKLHLFLPGPRFLSTLKSFQGKKFLKSTWHSTGIMWPQEKAPLSNFGHYKFFRNSTLHGFLAITDNFSISHFKKRALEWALETLEDIQGKHWGQTQSFSIQIFSNVATTSAYVLLL